MLNECFDQLQSFVLDLNVTPICLMPNVWSTRREENLLTSQMPLISGTFPDSRYRQPLLAIALISCRPNTHSTRDLKPLFMARGIIALMGIKVLAESTTISLSIYTATRGRGVEKTTSIQHWPEQVIKSMLNGIAKFKQWLSICLERYCIHIHPHGWIKKKYSIF